MPRPGHERGVAMETIRMQTVIEAAQALAQAQHGERGAIVQRAAAALNLSVQRTHALIGRAARDLGLAAPRKRRADAGRTAITDEELDLIAGVRFHGRRATAAGGKDMISLQETIDTLHEAGKLPNRLSASRVAQLLRQRGLDVRSLARPRAHVRMRTEHVNAVWEMDASVCVLYKTPKGELLMLEVDGVHYKNKPANLVQVVDDLLVRFVCTEHASGAIAARFYTGGETAENALDFLMWCMTQRTGANGEAMPFHGVPFTLYTDQGSAFRATVFRNFCSAMDIRQQWHAPRNSRATGQVENAQNLFERGLEARLRFMDAQGMTVQRLNAAAELWMHAFNGGRRHRRHGTTRYAAWASIASEHLRLAPSMEVMRALPASMAQPRKVTGDMRVQFALKGQGSREYDVRYVPGVSAGDKVYVTINPFDAPAVRVGAVDRQTGEIVWHQVQPAQEGWMGYDAAAPVLGRDDYRALPASDADERRARIAQQAFGEQGKAIARDAAKAAKATPYAGQFDPLGDLAAKAASLPVFLQRPGVGHQASAPSVEEERLSVAAACQLMRRELGDLYDSGSYAFLSRRYGDAGVPRSAVMSAIEQRRQPAPAREQPGLRVVNGGA
ncbi:transposase [Comamonadaceae bacterium OH2310_COT-174]|nr:transposase [Comamonadaceae bacterium OH2310_COT-174]